MVKQVIKSLTITHMPTRKWRATDNRIADFLVEFSGVWTGLDMRAVVTHLERARQHTFRDVRREDAKLTNKQEPENDRPTTSD